MAHTSDTPSMKTVRKVRQDPAFVRLERIHQALYHSRQRWEEALRAWLQGRLPDTEVEGIFIELERIARHTTFKKADLQRTLQELLLPFLEEAPVAAATRVPAPPVKQKTLDKRQPLPTGLSAPEQLSRRQPTVLQGQPGLIEKTLHWLRHAAAQHCLQTTGRRLRVLHLYPYTEPPLAPGHHTDGVCDRVVVIPPHWDTLILRTAAFRQAWKQWQELLGGPPDLLQVDDMSHAPHPRSHSRHSRVGGYWSRVQDAITYWPTLVRTDSPALLLGLPTQEHNDEIARQLYEKSCFYQLEITGHRPVLQPFLGTGFLLPFQEEPPHAALA